MNTDFASLLGIAATGGIVIAMGASTTQSGSRSRLVVAAVMGLTGLVQLLMAALAVWSGSTDTIELAGRLSLGAGAVGVAAEGLFLHARWIAVLAWLFTVVGALLLVAAI